MHSHLAALTLGSAFTQWRWNTTAAIFIVLLAAWYLRAVRRAVAAGATHARIRTVCFVGIGCGFWFLASMSWVGVYSDALFWVRALQVLLLYFVVPLGFALGTPVTVLRQSLKPPGQARLDAILHARSARILTHPAITSIAMIGMPFALYLTGWLPAALDNSALDALTMVILVLVGFGYFYSRLQDDPVPHHYPQSISLIVSIAETIADGVLGLVLWLGPPIAAAHYARLGLTWAPERYTDQTIGAGIEWILGDALGIPFLLLLLNAFGRDEGRKSARVDAQLQAKASAAAQDDQPATTELWWESDPQFRARYRR